MKKILLIIISMMLSYTIFADLNFGKDLFEDALYEEAIREFEKTIAAAPTSDEAQESMFLIGECYRAGNQYSLAEATYKRLLEGYPSLLFREEVIYYLALVQLELKKYERAIENFSILLEKYPLTNFAKQSLESYLQSIYEIGNYNRVIMEGKKLVDNYKDYPNIPNSYLWLAKAYSENKMPDDGNKILNKIINEFPNHVARWKAVNLEFEIMKKNWGEAKAAEKLEEKLLKDIPRIYERDLRLKLAKLYIKMSDFAKAYPHLKLMINKYGNAAELDEYILLFNETQLNLKKYTELENEFATNKKVFKNSKSKARFELNLAEAKFNLQKLEEANSILEDILDYAQDEKVLNEAKLLAAKLQMANGKYNAAIKSLQNLLNSEYSKKDMLYLLIGNIYFQQFKNYNTALKYFQQIATNFSSKEIWQEAVYKTALCYEMLGEDKKAMAELLQIDIKNVENENFKAKLIRKKDYLHEFKSKNYEKAFDKLLASMFVYFSDNNKDEFQNEIVSIYINELKDYESSLALIAKSSEPENIYQRSEIYLLLAQKAKAELKQAEAENYFNLADENMAKLSTEKHEKWITLLALKKELINTQDLNNELIEKIEKFVLRYPSSNAANKFLLLISNYYIENNDSEKAATYINKLKKDDSINVQDFYRAKIELAEYYYKIDNDMKALENYEKAAKNIGLHNPEIYFHYGVALYESGAIEKAKNLFTFLLQNTEQFESCNSAITYFTKILMENKEYQKAIKFMLFKKERDNDFYETLADNYLKIADQENAKEALMHIENKSLKTLHKLAILQYETRELEMAKYSFNELHKTDESNLNYLEMLGRIAYEQENFLEAAINYKKIIDKLGDKPYDNMPRVAKENIISLYRIENRPKAEKLQKRFKKILTKEIENEITLNEGIYYSKVDSKKAESIFSKLIKQKDISTDLIIKSYFWRGLVRLKKENMEEAEKDFITVSNSIDPILSNQAHFKLGTINFSNENFQEALSHYSAVIQNDIDGELAFDAARNFAYVCKTMKEWQKAIVAYQLILEKWGDEGLEAETLFDMAFCHFRDRRYTKAAEMFQRVIPILKDADQKAEAQYWIGESYFEMEEFEKAASELLKVRYSYGEITRWAASAELRVGEAYINLERIDRAKQIYERVIDRYGSQSQWGGEARKRLQDIK